MKTVIIGANSYIARNMIQLNHSKHYADKLGLFDYAENHIDSSINYCSINVFSQQEIERAVQGCELIYFFIGKTGTLQGFDAPEEYLDINEKPLFCLLNACRNIAFKGKIVFPSTRLVYKGKKDLLNETAEKEFLTPYAIQKYACEKYLMMYNRLFDIQYCILRICVPYGTLVSPVHSYGTADFFVKQAMEQKRITVYGKGLQRRTLTYIEDLCEILWEAGLNQKCINDVYNVGGQDASIREVAESVAGIFNVPVIEVPWPNNSEAIESGDTVFDSTKLEKILVNVPRMTIAEWLEYKR